MYITVKNTRCETERVTSSSSRQKGRQSAARRHSRWWRVCAHASRKWRCSWKEFGNKLAIGWVNVNPLTDRLIVDSAVIDRQCVMMYRSVAACGLMILILTVSESSARIHQLKLKVSDTYLHIIISVNAVTFLFYSVCFTYLMCHPM